MNDGIFFFGCDNIDCGVVGMCGGEIVVMVYRIGSMGLFYCFVMIKRIWYCISFIVLLNKYVVFL